MKIGSFEDRSSIPSISGYYGNEKKNRTHDKDIFSILVGEEGKMFK